MLKKQLQVKLGKNSYPIFIDKNILRDSGKIISNLGNFSSVIIITDNNVEKIYLDSVKKSLKQKFSNVSSVTLPCGEKTKSYYFLKLLLDKILAKKIDRQCLLIALGGGVIGDLVGFVSSLLLRGISYVQIPTTLLAQVDSSVGGEKGQEQSEEGEGKEKGKEKGKEEGKEEGKEAGEKGRMDGAESGKWRRCRN